MTPDPELPPDGGEAFPGEYHSGMSLRDYFATARGDEPITLPDLAAACKIARVNPKEIDNSDPASRLWLSSMVKARVKYMRADAMLRERALPVDYQPDPIDEGSPDAGNNNEPIGPGRIIRPGD